MDSLKKNHISWTFAGIVILILSVTVILQARYIHSLSGRLNNYHSQEDTSICKAEVDKLKSQIADMQTWQDYLEDALYGNNKESISDTQNRPAGNRILDNANDTMNNSALRNGPRSAISFRYDALAEEIGLSGETKSKLML